MFQTEVVEKIKTYFMFSKFFFRKSCRLWDKVGKKWYRRTGHTWQYDARALHTGYL